MFTLRHDRWRYKLQYTVCFQANFSNHDRIFAICYTIILKNEMHNLMGSSFTGLFSTHRTGNGCLCKMNKALRILVATGLPASGYSAKMLSGASLIYILNPYGH